jgi:asparagine synthase (glutamine-hydrolysing)
VFRLAKESGVKVMLDGQGADELLGGYHGLVAARLASLVRQGRWAEAARFAARASRAPGRGALPLWAGEFLTPASLQEPLRRIVGQELAPAWLNRGWFTAHGYRMAAAKYGAGVSREVLREQMCRLLTRTNLPMLLRYEDRNSMAHSIESRVPFLTPALAELAMSLPEEYLIDAGGTTKAVFRRAMRGLVPDAILDRRDKIGFATPEHDWMPALRPFVERALASDVAARIPALEPEALRAEWRQVLERRPRRDFRVWRWVNFIEWAGRTRAEFA